MAPPKKRVKKAPPRRPTVLETPLDRAEKYNPIELYQYSLVSEENQEIAKSIGKEKPPSKMDIHFDGDVKVLLKFSEEDQDEWSFEVKDKEDDPEMTYDEKDQKLTINGKEDIIERGFKLIKELMNLFGSTIDSINLHGRAISGGREVDGLNDENLQQVIEWINNSESSSIREIETRGIISSFHATIVQNIEKPVEHMKILGELDAKQYPDGVKFNKKLVMDHLEIYFGPVNLKTLLTINCEKLNLKEGTTMKNEDVNAFLRKWQNGEAQTRLKANPHEWYIKTSEVLKLKKILKGLSPVIRDPRTTKRPFISDHRSDRWLHGGVDVTRKTDGKVMSIQCLHYDSTEKDDRIPIKVIKEFEKVKNWDWNDESEDVKLGGRRNDGYLVLHIW